KRAEEDLEKLFRQNAEELERFKAERAQQTAETAAADSASRTQMENATKVSEQAEASLKEVTARCTQLEQELAGLKNRLRDSETSREADLSHVDQRVRDRVSSLARVTADLEKERA